MSMETAGWIVGGWFAVALVVSLIAGRILRYTTTAMDEAELNEIITSRKVLRYLRHGKRNPKTAVPALQQAAAQAQRKAR